MKILISGAGISGLTLAYWLKKYGFKPTLIEIAPTLRNKGYMMDFFSSGYDVAEAMDMVPDLLKVDQAHDLEEIIFVHANAKRRGSFTRKAVRDYLDGKYVSIMRGELEDLIYEKVKGNVPIRFDTCIKKIHSIKESAEVTFEDGKKESFDLVIGADGFRSKVRELTFGSQDQFTHFMGYTVAAFLFEDKNKMGNNFYLYNEVDRMVGMHPLANGKAAAFVVFKSKQLGSLNLEERKAVLREKFKGGKGLMPEMLEAMEGVDEIFFDEVSQIRMPQWSKGRVTLVGDAGACLTLLAGQGASMGMAEAYVLATELKKSKGDYASAFKNYENILLSKVRQKQEEAKKITGSFVPKNKFSLLLANVVTRFMHWPFMIRLVFQGAGLESVFGEGGYKISNLH